MCVALVIQHAKRMSRVIWSSVTSAALLYFPTLFINTTIFGKMLLNINFGTFLILRRTELDVFIGVHWSSRKTPVTLVKLWGLNFFERFSVNPHISNFMKFRPVGAELFHEDGQTDTTKRIFTFRNFVNTLNNLSRKVSFEINEEMKWVRVTKWYKIQNL